LTTNTQLTGSRDVILMMWVESLLICLGTYSIIMVVT